MTSWTVARQASLSMEFSRQEYWSDWSGLSFPTPGGLPDPGTAPPALAGRFFATVLPGELLLNHISLKIRDQALCKQ